MLGQLGAYIRQQHLALLALFIALGGSAYAAATIDSADVVDNSLTGADVKGQKAKGRQKFAEGTLTGDDVRGSAVPGRKAVDGSLFGVDIADNSLTGADLNEATLATVPGADTLDGRDSSEFVPLTALADYLKKTDTAGNADRLDNKDSADFLASTGTAVNAAQLGGQGPSAHGTGVYTRSETIASCGISVNTNNHCADIPVRVPAGKTYRAVIWSSFSALTGPNVTTFYYCPELVTGGSSACLSQTGGNALGTTAPGGYLASGAATAVVVLNEGTSTIATRINPNNTVGTSSNPNQHATTTVMLFDTAVPEPPYLICDVHDCGGTSGATSSGATSSGATSSGATSSGATSSGATSSGATSSGATSSGATSSGTSG